MKYTCVFICKLTGNAAIPMGSSIIKTRIALSMLKKFNDCGERAHCVLESFFFKNSVVNWLTNYFLANTNSEFN